MQISSVPLIPRLTSRGKIRFLEKQRSKINRKLSKKSAHYALFTSDIGSVGNYNQEGFMSYWRRQSEPSKRKIIQKLIPLYEAVGRTEDVNRLKTYLQGES